MALAASLEHLGTVSNNSKAMVLAKTLDDATSVFLDEDKGPERDVGQLDNRGSHFYLALYWAEALATQTADAELQKRFAPLAKQLRSEENSIVSELNSAQGFKINVEGYYLANPQLCQQAMRPCASFNRIIDALR
jgi:isocitrate dehydrogenase